MKISINQHNLFNALIFTIVLSAITHLVICFFRAIFTGNIDYINMFNVLGISYIFPALGTGAFNAVLGAVLIIGIGMVAYFYLELKNKK